MIIGVSGKQQTGKDTIGKIIQWHLISKEKTLENLKNYLNKEYDDLILKLTIIKYAEGVKEILSMLSGISVKDMELEEVKRSFLPKEWDLYEKCCFNLGEIESKTGVCLTCGTKLEKKKTTVRKALQLIGTDLFRNEFHYNTWVNLINNKYLNPLIEYKKNNKEIKIGYIITDVRLQNEADNIKDKGGIVIRVNRDYYNYENKIVSWTELVQTLADDMGDHISKSYADANLLIRNNHQSENDLDEYKNFDYIIDNNGSLMDLAYNIEQILIKEKIL
jgi:hypothetical protein